MINLISRKFINSRSYFPNKRNHLSGFSIVEILIYLAIFASISILVINSFITILSSFSTTNTNRKLLESGSVIMERMSREIRQSQSVNVEDSDNNPINTKFTIEDQNLNIYQEGALVGGLLDQNISITKLIFRRIVTANGEAVKIEMTLLYSDSRTSKSENFYNTIVLRGGY